MDETAAKKEKMQLTFDTVYKHLMQQNLRSMVGGKCAYRGDDDLKCAIGCLIPDDVFNFTYNSFSIKEPESRAMIPDHYTKSQIFLTELQHIHDTKPVSKWDELLRKFAEKWNLEVPELDKDLI